MVANQPPQKRRTPPDKRDEEDALTIDENALRERPEWLESVGDEEEDPQLIERNIREEWGNLDEDDFVSSPVSESDDPDWTDKDYDDEASGDKEEGGRDPYRYS